MTPVLNNSSATRVYRLYYGEWLSYLADKLEAEAARNARLSAKLKDLSRRAKAGELDMPNVPLTGSLKSEQGSP
jgi:hypothetical protein